MEHILLVLTNFIINTISTLGYGGVALLMAIESACIPLPSEIIMPFAGYLVFKGQFSLLGIALAGAIGNTLGSVVIYYIGVYGGRPLLEKYGKYVLISGHDIDMAEKFFKKYDSWAAFLGRLLPVVRTFISLPAGVAKAPLGQFALFTFVGSFLWSYLLGYLGFKLGPQWENLHSKLQKFDYLIVAVIVGLIVFWVWRHLKNRPK